MGYTDSVQLSKLVDGDDPASVVAESRRIFGFWYGAGSWRQVEAVSADIIAMFKGRFPGYRACDTDYHDIRHTMAVVLATARIADGIFIERGAYPETLGRNLFIAALCHDTGYIRTVDEEGGTGARFTAVHVSRSADFARANAARWGLSEADGACVARLISATGLKGEYGQQAWASAEEREAGASLASGDLVGQMSDRAYLEKLLFLYYEFKEAGFPGYDTEFDILRKTMGFYEMTIGLLDGTLGGVRAKARRHFSERWGADSDLYAEAMDRQIAYLQGILDDTTTNFRKKLKRLDLESTKPRSA